MKISVLINHWEVHNLFICLIPVKLFIFTVSSCSHDTCNGVPKSGVNVTVCHQISLSNAVDPVVDMKFAVIAADGRGKFYPIFRSRYYFCFSAFHQFFHLFVKIKPFGEILMFLNEKPSELPSLP